MSTAPKEFVGSHKQKDWPKHIVIWAFIIIELFPLYMMFQVSFKDNASFLRNPWLPTPPFSVVETRQAADGTETAKTRVADWSEAFSSAKPSDPSVKSVEKSFDLSVYKVKNWNFSRWCWRFSGRISSPDTRCRFPGCYGRRFWC